MHQFGTSYELEIRYEWLGTQNADAPSFTIELLKVISATQDLMGTTYLYPVIELNSTGVIIKDSDGKYWIGHYQFLCAANQDCDTLVNISNSGGKVDLEFTLTGGEVPVTLTRWL